jgi:hypothetical protein
MLCFKQTWMLLECVGSRVHHSSDRTAAAAAQENVLLDSEGHVKVTDFGLAKPGLGDDTRTNSFIGTMEACAPCTRPPARTWLHFLHLLAASLLSCSHWHACALQPSLACRPTCALIIASHFLPMLAPSLLFASNLLACLLCSCRRLGADSSRSLDFITRHWISLQGTL